MMKKLQAIFLALLLATLCACGAEAIPTAPSETAPSNSAETTLTVIPEATGKQNVVIIGQEWGPSVVKTIVTLDQTLAASSVNVKSFRITQHNGTTVVGTELPLTDAYPCDQDGNKVNGDSNRIAIEIECRYDALSRGGVASPFVYDFLSGRNVLRDPYELRIRTTDRATLMTSEGIPIESLNVQSAIDLDRAIYPQLENVELSCTYTAADGIALTYGIYSPAVDDKRNALVIWLHGAGEGGVDNRVAILGNEVTALYSEEFQSLFGGAYVLTPQTPTMWMDDGSGRHAADGNSIYLSPLFGLIDSFVKANPDVDPNRILIGGCSNGGYMTMNLIMTYPDYFAAAFPICEAYGDSYITDDMLAGIAHMPIWFVHARNDTVVNPDTHSAATYTRLKAIHANVYYSEFADVGEYVGHWSWVHFFNDACQEEGINMWEWMSKQIRKS